MSWIDAETINALISGFLLTIALTIGTGTLAMILGLATGAARMSQQRRWRWPALLHITIHRHVPALVIMIFWAFAVPSLFVPELRRTLFFDNDMMRWLGQLTEVALPYYLLAASAGLILNSSAYIAELFRVGMGALSAQQLAVATTLGATSWQRFWLLLAPQGLSIAWPAITTRLIHNMKNTALASFLAVPEFFNVIQGAVNRTFEVAGFFLIAAVVYLLLAAILTAILGRLGERLGAPLSLPLAIGRKGPELAIQLRRLSRERG